MQRIDALQMAAGDRHAQHRHRRFGGNHAGQVGGAARAGNDGLEATPYRGFGVGKHIVRHTVGRDHPCLVGDAKVLENFDCVLHGVPVAAGAHDYADLDGCHSYIERHARVAAKM